MERGGKRKARPPMQVKTSILAPNSPTIDLSGFFFLLSLRLHKKEKHFDTSREEKGKCFIIIWENSADYNSLFPQVRTWQVAR